jgi:lysophospholipase L1-like esterase
MKLRSLLVNFALGIVPLFTAGAASAQTVFLIGDSTVSNFSPPDPRNGWGQVIGRNFASDVVVKNFARSGRSSKSFFEEGAWAPVVPMLKPGDYVFIQFGHNDEKRDAERGTEPYSTYQEYLSRYIDDTLKAGAIPILVTPVGRGGLKKSSGPGSHGRYPDAMLELAKQRKLLSIDLTSLSEAYFRKLGTSDTLKLFVASIDGKDDTHFLPAGAVAIANLVAQAIKGLDIPLAQKVVITE